MNGYHLSSALLGCLIALSLPELPSVWLCLLAPVPILLGWLYPRFVCLSWAGVAFFWTLFRMHHALDWVDPELQGRNLTISGQVSGLPRVEKDYASFEFLIEPASVDGSRLPRRVKLSWYHPTIAINPGQAMTVVVELAQPHARLNPGGYDAERMAVLRGIQGYGKVVSLVSKKAPSGYLPNVDLLRDKLSQKIAKAAPGATSSLLQGLILADRRSISEAQWSALRQTGTAHLMAVSGLHVGTIAALGWYIGIGLGRLVARRTYCLTAIHTACLTSASMSLGYAVLAGFSLPTQRAVTMLAMLYLVRLRRWRVSNARVLGAVVLIAVSRDPIVLLGVSFWLSFGAAWVLIKTFEGRIAPPGKARSWLLAQGNLLFLSGTLGFLFFATVPLAAPLANLVCIPVVSLIVLPLAMLGAILEWSFDAGRVFLCLSGRVLELVLIMLDCIASYAPAVNRVSPDGALWRWGLVIVGLLLFSQPHPVIPRPALALFLLPMVVRPGPALKPGDFDVHVLDVGQGLSVVIETRDNVIVYDTGRISPSGANSGEDIIVPFLQSRNIEVIDLLVVSHGDSDHAGGIQGLLSTIPAKRILTSSEAAVNPVLQDLKARRYARDESVEVMLCSRGWRWARDNVRFTVWHPFPGLPYLGNDSSCVVRVESAAGSLLLPGDITMTAELGLLADPLSSDLLIAPHHGSTTSSSAAFINLVRPAWVVFTAGFKNPFDFPREAVQRRYADAHIQQASTFDTGMITYEFRQNAPLRMLGYRASNPRWWRKKPGLQASTRPQIRK